MQEREMYVGYRLLDDQLVDVNGRRCGRVDDLEFDGKPGGVAVLTAVLTGSGNWHRRLPRRLRKLGARVFGEGMLGKDVVRVPWPVVEDVEVVVKLRSPAQELGLGHGDDRIAPLFGRETHS